MKEFDTRLNAKMLSEFITPEPLRIFLANKIKGTGLSVLDPAIGSGQLIFNIAERCKIIHGFDVNLEAISMACDNFQVAIVAENRDFITSQISNKYDVAIANYPFSLRPTSEQSEYLLKDSFLKQFYSGKITGVLDFIFILKSFNAAEEGFFFCFPGIGYRAQELKFRRYLIENKFLMEYGLIENCEFEHTSIPILFLHLTKKKNESVNSFKLDLKTGEILNKVINKFDDNLTFEIPQKETVQQFIDGVALERSARKSAIDDFILQIKMSLNVWQIDEDIRKELEPLDIWIERCIDLIRDLLAARRPT